MVNGDRIRQIREMRRLSQADLADQLGVTQPMIAHIESGRFPPSDPLLHRLAAVLGFPPSYFTKRSTSDFPMGSLLFRSKSDMAAAERTELYRLGQTVFEGVEQLLQAVHPIPVRVPRLEEDPAEAARVTRSVLGLSPDKPIDHLTHVLERAGVLVIALPVASTKAEAFSLWAGGAERPVIVCLADKAGDRMRFSLAHELGHLVLHWSRRNATRNIEKDVNVFAGEFMMPEAAMRQELIPPITLTDLGQLKVRWRMSMQSILMRAYELEIITLRQFRYLLQQMRSMGWRTEEPESLAVPVEKPRMFRQLAEMLYGNPPNVQRMALDLGWPTLLAGQILDAYIGKPPEAKSHPRDAGNPRVIPFPRSGTQN